MGETPLSYMPFIIKATSMAMHKFPQLNVRLSPDGMLNDVKSDRVEWRL